MVTTDDIAQSLPDTLSTKIKNISFIENGIETSAKVTFNDSHEPIIFKIHETENFPNKEGFLAGPHLIRKVDQRTNAPVPDIKFISEDGNKHISKPYYIMEFVNGQEFSKDLQISEMEKLLKDSGSYLSQLHSISTDTDFFGWSGWNGESIQPFEEYSSFQRFLVDHVHDCLQEIKTGGRYPEKRGDEEYRFSEDVEEIEEFHSILSSINLEDSKRSYCHWDYRSDNILIDQDDGKPEICAIIDWDSPMIADPLYNLARAESKLITKFEFRYSQRIQRKLKDALYESYQNEEGYTVNVSDRESNVKLTIYRIIPIIELMMSFDLWFQNYPQKHKDAAEEYYRRQLHKQLKKLQDQQSNGV